jgi:hypothetical protein
MVVNAIRTGIYIGFSVLGFIWVIVMGYFFLRALMCLSGYIAARVIGDEFDDEDFEEDADETMDD